MRIEKRQHYLVAYSYIDFGDNSVFCGMPYVHLLANRDYFNKNWWKENTIGIAIQDNDDFEMGLEYETDREHFFTVLHELINWMVDHEQGITMFEKLINPFEFFPDCGCKRVRWK